MAEPTTSGSDTDPSRLDRRQAMKIALGGATAAAVFAAPRIEGFGIAPDYAAAATANCVDSTASAAISRSSAPCPVSACWGVPGPSCLCPNTPLGSTTVTPPAETPPYTTPTLTVDVGGRILTNGRYTLALSGFTAGQPWDRCVATVTGSCSSGTFTTSAPTQTFTANDTVVGTLRCAGGTASSTGTVSITMTCYCT